MESDEAMGRKEPDLTESQMVAEGDEVSGESGSDEGASASTTRPDVESQRRHEGHGTEDGGYLDDRRPLLSVEQRQQLAGEWSQIQVEFVDHPRESVQRADGLVVDVMQRVTSSFSRERERLEAQWEQGDSVSTEDLRTALTHYRSFFDRLLTA
jgi:hypothetical protein